MLIFFVLTSFQSMSMHHVETEEATTETKNTPKNGFSLGDAETALNMAGTAQNISEKGGKNALLGTVVAAGGLYVAKHFVGCASSPNCVQSTTAPTPGTYGVRAPMCVQAGSPGVCKAINYTIAGATAVASIAILMEALEQKKIAEEVTDPTIQLPPDICESTPILCQSNATIGSYGTPPGNPPGNLPPIEFCLDPATKKYCVELDEDGNPVLNTGGKNRYTQEELEEAVETLQNTYPSVGEQLTKAKRHFGTLAQNSILDDKKKKTVGKDKKKKKKQSLVGTYKSGDKNYDSSYETESSETSDDDNPFKGLMAQFMKKKKEKRNPAETVSLGKDKVGTMQNNIFMIAHRRYQKLRTRQIFIETSTKIKKSFTHSEAL